MVLDAAKVPAKKRNAWLKREVVAKNRRVLLCNPAAVETGLNCLTHFSTLVWFQPPDCDPRAKRQAEGRIYRIGQTCPVRVYWLIYKGTSQEVLHKLLLKVAESEAVDGLDPASPLQASGIGTPAGMTGFDLGRAIFEAVEAEATVKPAGCVTAGVAVAAAAAPATEMVSAVVSSPATEPLPLPPPQAAPLAVTAPCTLVPAIVAKRVGRAGTQAQLGWIW